MSNRKATYTLELNSNVIALLQQHEAAAMRFDNTMWQVQKTLSAFGVGLGAHFLIDGAKSWIQASADYEQAMLRIKFASKSLDDGLKNQSFILGEVEKFKIPIQEATDAYGKFLAMVGSSGLAGDQVRTLHDQLLMIAKIKGVSNAQMDQTVYNLGKLLEEPRMDAQHLKFLSIALPGFAPYLAKAEGISMSELANIIKSHKTGDLNKAGLLEAVRMMSEDLGQNLPEALTSQQSALNDLSNRLYEFKTQIVTDLRPELIGLFDSLKDGIHWMKEHEDTIISVGKAVYEVAKLYIEWKVAMFAINGISSLWNLALGTQVGNTIRQTTATTALNGEIALLNANLETQIFLLEQLAFQSNVYAESQAIAGATNWANNLGTLPINMNGVANTSSAMAGLAGIFSRALVPVFIAGMALEVIDELAPQDRLAKQQLTISDWVKFNEFQKLYSISKGEEAQSGLLWELQQLYNSRTTPASYDILTGTLKPSNETKLDPKGTELYDLLSKYSNMVDSTLMANGKDPYGILDLIDKQDEHGDRKTLNSELYQLLKTARLPYPGFIAGSNYTSTNTGNDPDTSDLKAKHLKGNTVTNINIQIDEMNGINRSTFPIKNMKDYDNIKEIIGEEIVRRLTDAVNDAQLVGKHH